MRLILEILRYVDLSSYYEVRFAIIFIDMNINLDLSTAIKQF